MSSLKYEIKNILKYHFAPLDADFEIDEATQKICDKIEDNLMTGIRTAIQVNIHGIPQ